MNGGELELTGHTHMKFALNRLDLSNPLAFAESAGVAEQLGYLLSVQRRPPAA